MRRALIAAIVATGIFASSAEAHVTVTPARVLPGEERLVTFIVPNEGTRPIDGFSVGLNGLRLEGVEAKRGWNHFLGNGYFLTFHGGPIRAGSFERFTISVTVPERLRSFEFEIVERSGDTIVGNFHPTIAIGRVHTFYDESNAHQLAKWALFVALAAAALGLGAGALALAGWLKRP